MRELVDTDAEAGEPAFASYGDRKSGVDRAEEVSVEKAVRDSDAQFAGKVVVARARTLERSRLYGFAEGADRPWRSDPLECLKGFGHFCTGQSEDAVSAPTRRYDEARPAESAQMGTCSRWRPSGDARVFASRKAAATEQGQQHRRSARIGQRCPKCGNVHICGHGHGLRLSIGQARTGLVAIERLCLPFAFRAVLPRPVVKAVGARKAAAARSPRHFHEC
jgi:hypothetical protein